MTTPLTIPLTQDQQAIVDERDWRRLSEHKWSAAWNSDMKSFYASRHSPRVNGKQHTIRMHCEIMGLLPGDKRHVHHVNHDTLDNRRENLEILTAREHSGKRRDQSQYGVGIQRRKKLRKPYLAHVYVDGKNNHIGHFATPEEAQEGRKKFLGELQEVQK